MQKKQNGIFLFRSTYNKTGKIILPDNPNKPVKGSINIDWWILGTGFYIWNLRIKQVNVIIML